jgi:endonuclease YncB( thermonuclease family)
MSWCEEKIAATAAEVPPTGRLPVGVIEKSMRICSSARLGRCRFHPLIHLPQRTLALFAMAMAAAVLLAAGKGAVAAPAASYRATVLSVGDGDTLRVQAGGQSITIRLACIDAPEKAQSPWGQQSRAYLMQRLPRGREVTIQPHTTDRYGRTVAEVISEININLVMVEDGQAFAYRRYLSGCDAKEYLDAEYRASRHRYGVWQQEGGITRPWDFRRGPTATATVRPASRCAADSLPSAAHQPSSFTVTVRSRSR